MAYSRFCASFLSVASLCLCVLLAPSLQADDRDARLAALRQNMESLKRELARVKHNRSSLVTELEISEKKIGELSRQIEGLQSQIEGKQQQLQQLQQQKSELETAKEKQKSAATEHLRALHRLGQQAPLQMLAAPQDANQRTRNLYYLKQVAQAHQFHLNEYQTQTEHLGRLEPQIAEALTAIEQDRTRAESQKSKLAALSAERKKTLRAIDQQIAGTDARLKTLEADQKTLQTVVNRAREVTDDFKLDFSNRNFAQLKGLLPWPSKGPILQRFGAPKVQDKLRWEGIVIGAPEGTPVRAVHDGRVVFSDYLRGQGMLIMIDHGSGFMTLYAHNRALFKRVGDWAKAGDQVAEVGNSGGQTASHLYFELRYKGEPTNPQTWL